jgi:hypothetical protein
MNAHTPLLSLIVACTVWGCAAEPVAPPPRPEPPPLPDTNVYFYPTAGRSVPAEQQERDKYECNEWAVQQTGFDPSNPQVPPHRRMRIVAGGPPPGAQVGADAVTGAVVASERNEEINRMQAQTQTSAWQVQTARVERQATDFRRALSACLEARSYSVK